MWSLPINISNPENTGDFSGCCLVGKRTQEHATKPQYLELSNAFAQLDFNAYWVNIYLK